MESVQENAKSACVRLEDELEDELSLAGLDRGFITGGQRVCC